MDAQTSTRVAKARAAPNTASKQTMPEATEDITLKATKHSGGQSCNKTPSVSYAVLEHPLLQTTTQDHAKT